MPFSADSQICAALLRTGDKALEPKAALKWAKAICRALKPKDQAKDELGKKQSASINTLSLISGVVVVSGTGEEDVRGDGQVEDKARLAFQAFDFMQGGAITATECTILFLSLWRAVAIMSGLGSELPDGRMERNTAALLKWINKDSTKKVVALLLPDCTPKAFLRKCLARASTTSLRW